jgi:hypothetical protein
MGRLLRRGVTTWRDRERNRLIRSASLALTHAVSLTSLESIVLTRAM